MNDGKVLCPSKMLIHTCQSVCVYVFVPYRKMLWLKCLNLTCYFGLTKTYSRYATSNVKVLSSALALASTSASAVSTQMFVWSRYICGFWQINNSHRDTQTPHRKAGLMCMGILVCSTPSVGLCLTIHSVSSNGAVVDILRI